MHRFLKKTACFILAAMLLCVPASAQKNKKAANTAKKKEQVERDYKKSYARARKLTIKHRREIQTDATKERMDVVDKKAREWNTQNDPTFFERWFKKKRHKKR
jgi:hypothetical protein